jgi:dihydroneopterin aldolase
MAGSSDAADSVHIEQLEVFGRVGVTENERSAPQRLALTITLWPGTAFNELEDDISCTVNYSAAADAARDFVRDNSFKLIETLGDALASHLLKTFSINKLEIEVRKFVLPQAKYVAVSLVRAKKGS